MLEVRHDGRHRGAILSGLGLERAVQGLQNKIARVVVGCGLRTVRRLPVHQRRDALRLDHRAEVAPQWNLVQPHPRPVHRGGLQAPRAHGLSVARGPRPALAAPAERFVAHQ